MIEKGQSEPAKCVNSIGFNAVFAFSLKTLPRSDPRLFLVKRRGGGGRSKDQNSSFKNKDQTSKIKSLRTKIKLQISKIYVRRKKQEARS